MLNNGKFKPKIGEKSIEIFTNLFFHVFKFRNENIKNLKLKLQKFFPLCIEIR